MTGKIRVKYLDDILTSTNKILSYVGESSFDEVMQDEMRLEAIT